MDENDRSGYGYRSSESLSSVCSEIENAFYPLRTQLTNDSMGSSSEFSAPDLCISPPLFSPTIPHLLYSTNFQPGPVVDPSFARSAFVPLARNAQSRLVHNPRVMKKSSFGSVGSATTSEESGDRFFYI